MESSWWDFPTVVIMGGKSFFLAANQLDFEPRKKDSRESTSQPRKREEPWGRNQAVQREGSSQNHTVFSGLAGLVLE